MAFRSDWGIRGVGNCRERKVLRGIRPDVVLRGESLSARRSGIHRRRCTAWRGDESLPASSLVVTKLQFLLEVLVVALDPPAQLGGVDRGAAADGGRKRR